MERTLSVTIKFVDRRWLVTKLPQQRLVNSRFFGPRGFEGVKDGGEGRFVGGTTSLPHHFYEESPKEVSTKRDTVDNQCSSYANRIMEPVVARLSQIFRLFGGSEMV